MSDFSQLRQFISGSAMVVVFIPYAAIDAKIAVELGLAIMLDKPIIAVILPGVQVSEKLARTIDHFVEYDPKNTVGVANAIRDIVASGKIKKDES